MENIPQFKVVQDKTAAYEAAQEALATAKTAAQDALATFNAAEKKTEAAQSNYNAIHQNTTDAQEALTTANNKLTTANGKLTEANGKLTEAKNSYDAAVTAAATARNAYSKALGEAAEALKKYNEAVDDTEEAENDYNEKQGIVDTWPEDQKTTTEPGTEEQEVEAPFPEYADFYNASEKNIASSSNLKLYYGAGSVSGKKMIVFATSDIINDVKNILPNSSKFSWYDTAFTPNDFTETSYNDLLDAIMLEDTEITGLKTCRFYYKNDEGALDFGTPINSTSFASSNPTSVPEALTMGYVLVTRKQIVRVPVEKEVDTEEYAKAKAEAEAARLNWVAKQKEESALKKAYDKAVSNAEVLKLEADSKDEAVTPLKTAWEDAKSTVADAQAAVTTAQDAVYSAQTALANAQAAETAPLTALQNAQAEQAAAESAKTKADAAVITAQGEVTTKKAELEEAKKPIQKKNEDGTPATDKNGDIICEDEYNTIAINGSFTITATELSETSNNYLLSNLPAGYTLNGNGAVISGLNLNKSLFNENAGTISQLATPAGHIANANPGTASQCLTNWGGKYRLYGNDGKTYTENASIEELLYQNRLTSPFGYDIVKKEVQTAAPENKLFQAKYPNPNAKGQLLTFKLNIADNSLKYTASLNKDGKPVSENAIIYLEENEDAATEAAEANKNVAVKDEFGTYVCYDMELTDVQNAREFYIPENYEFTTNKVTYGRKFNQEYAAVCFPFSLTPAIKEALGIADSYQFYETNTTTGVMWFSRWGTVPANKPCIIKLKDNVSGNIFENKEAVFAFEATPAELSATNDNGEKVFYGTYKSATGAELLGDNSTDAIYGIQNGNLVKASDTSKFLSFRSYVRTPKISTTAGAPSYKIGLMDEDGNEITAIETVRGEIVSGFKAKGGDNAIEIMTDEACAVKVYTLNGALVKSTRVEAGVTSLPVKAGIYVVNGAKVIVK